MSKSCSVRDGELAQMWPERRRRRNDRVQIGDGTTVAVEVSMKCIAYLAPLFFSLAACGGATDADPEPNTGGSGGGGSGGSGGGSSGGSAGSAGSASGGSGGTQPQPRPTCVPHYERYGLGFSHPSETVGKSIAGTLTEVKAGHLRFDTNAGKEIVFQFPGADLTPHFQIGETITAGTDKANNWRWVEGNKAIAAGLLWNTHVVPTEPPLFAASEVALSYEISCDKKESKSFALRATDQDSSQVLELGTSATLAGHTLNHLYAYYEYFGPDGQGLVDGFFESQITLLKVK